MISLPDNPSSTFFWQEGPTASTCAVWACAWRSRGLVHSGHIPFGTYAQTVSRSCKPSTTTSSMAIPHESLPPCFKKSIDMKAARIPAYASC